VGFKGVLFEIKAVSDVFGCLEWSYRQENEE
jgi:hypothetical protein